MVSSSSGVRCNALSCSLLPALGFVDVAANLLVANCYGKWNSTSPVVRHCLFRIPWSAGRCLCWGASCCMELVFNQQHCCYQKNQQQCCCVQFQFTEADIWESDPCHNSINLSQAQTWVDKMSASEPDEPNDKDFEGRPARYIIHWFFLLYLNNWYVTAKIF